MQNDHTKESDPGEVSFVIVTYWTGPLLTRAVASCLAQPATREVILVDNGNWPGFDSKLRAEIGSLMERVHILTGHGNIGFAKACNLGAAQAKGGYIFFLNPDAELKDNALEIMLREGQALSRPWMIGGKLLNKDGSEQAGARRQNLTPGTAFVEMTRLYKLAPNHPRFKRFNDHETTCPADVSVQPVISGACMLLPKESYFAIGGMDGRYFLHLEDVDFCVRFTRAGGRIYFVPNAAVMHAKGASRSNTVRVERHKAVSLCRYFLTHYKEVYPAPFLWVVCGLVWVSFCLRSGISLFRSLWRLLKRRPMQLRATLRRARHIFRLRQKR